MLLTQTMIGYKSLIVTGNLLQNGVLTARLRTGSGCIDPDGSGPLQKGDGQFDHPGDVTLDSSGELLYVTDSRNNRIQKFDSDGKFITKWGSQGITDGKFDFPTGLACRLSW